MTTCVVAYGNPFDGLRIVGPFDSPDEAGDYAEDKLRSEHWWIVRLEQKEES